MLNFHKVNYENNGNFYKDFQIGYWKYYDIYGKLKKQKFYGKIER